MSDSCVILFQPFAYIPAEMMKIKRTDTMNSSIDCSRLLIWFIIDGEEFHRVDKIVDFLRRENLLERCSCILSNLFENWREDCRLLFRASGVPFVTDIFHSRINKIPHTTLGNPTACQQQYENQDNRKYRYDGRGAFFRHVDAGSNCTCHENKTCKNSERII